jgi:uncharacterized protein (TIGR02246 family)
MNLKVRAVACTAFFALYMGAAHANDELFDAMDAGNQAVVAAIMAGDAESVAAGYTDDAYVLAPDAATVRGREDIRAFWQGLIDSGVQNVVINTGEVASSGDLAYVVGTIEVTGEDNSTEQSRYVLVFKRVSGEWRLHLDIWTPSK